MWRTGEQGILKTRKFIGEAQFYKLIFTNNCRAIFVIIDRIFMEQYFYLKEYFVMDYMVHHPSFCVLLILLN